MKIQKTAMAISVIALLSTTLVAETNNYIGFKAGTLNTSKSVYGNDSDTGEVFLPIKYNDVSLMGVEYQLLHNFENNLLMWGMGVEVMFNDGNFLNGGTAGLDFKFGTHYKDFNFYGLAGVGIQSLSSYTVATGAFYGAGINYNLFKHMGLNIEYKNYNLKTTDNDEITANQSYSLSGILASVSVKF